MSYKKYVIFLVVLLCLILSMFYLFNVISFDDIPLGMAVSSQTSRYKDVKSGLEDMQKGKDKIILDLDKTNTCYWIRTILKKGKYVLEINEYENSDKIKGCLGDLKNTQYIELKNPINLHGVDCVCSEDVHTFEWQSKDHLKISKSGKSPSVLTKTTIPETSMNVKPVRRVGLDIQDALSEFIKNIFRR